MDEINKLLSLSDDEVSKVSKKELQRLLDQLRDAIAKTKEQLQAAQEKREREDKDIEQCILARDRQMPTVIQADGDNKKGRALRKLNEEVERGRALTRQLEEQEASRSRFQGSANDLKEMRKEEAALVEKEKRLNLLCAKMRKSLVDTQGRCLAAEDELRRLQGRGSAAESGQSHRRMQDQLVDKYVASLDIPAAVARVSVKPKRGRKIAK